MKWSFPKGHKERGESYIDCAIRETFEETGIDLRCEEAVSYQRLSVGDYYFFEIEEQPITIHDPREILDARWMTISEIKDVYCNVDVSNFLMRMKRDLRAFQVRE